jgi:hypothetical protein
MRAGPTERRPLSHWPFLFENAVLAANLNSPPFVTDEIVSIAQIAERLFGRDCMACQRRSTV